MCDEDHEPGTDFLGTNGRVLPGCCPVVAQHGGFARARKHRFKIRDLSVPKTPTLDRQSIDLVETRARAGNIPKSTERLLYRLPGLLAVFGKGANDLRLRVAANITVT